MKRPDFDINAARRFENNETTDVCLKLIAWIDHLERRSRERCRWWHSAWLLCSCPAMFYGFERDRSIDSVPLRECIGPCDCGHYDETHDHR